MKRIAVLTTLVMAFSLAFARPAVKVAPAPDGGFEVSADSEALDAYVIALGRAGVAVRMLERRTRSLESLFLELTGHKGSGDPPLTRPTDASDREQVSVVTS